jgi:hypothetical protein
MAFRRTIVLAILTLAPQLAPAEAVAQVPAAPVLAPLTEELVLDGDNIVTVTINGMPLRFQVSADAFGPPVINPDVAARLMLWPEGRRGWLFGPVNVDGAAATVLADFGAGPAPISVAWTARPASQVADGVVGVHDLPHARVTFALHAPAGAETETRFALRRMGGRNNTRLGTEIAVGKRKLLMIFVTERAENLITAPTANFIATHHEGGFEPGSDGIAVMNFGIERPTRVMRLAEPITLGALLLHRFAVRIEDYGTPREVGEIAEGDPRFDKNNILVSRRKGRGKPDLLTRIGRDQIAHCSRLTYDFALEEIRLTCAPQPAEVLELLGRSQAPAGPQAA